MKTGEELQVIDTNIFLSAVQLKWQEYGNIYSPDLRRVWLMIFAMLQHQASAAGTTRWPVIPAELGVGKTTCAKMWCSMIPDYQSALVVVRTREQAKEFADDVNAWSGEKRAAAIFSPDKKAGLPNDYWADADETKIFPVVVACHKTYSMGLDAFSLQATQARFETLHQYVNKRRDVVIVDEALDQVAEACISRGAMSALLRLIPLRIQHAHDAAIYVFESVQRALRLAPLDRARALTATEMLAYSGMDIATATARLDALWETVRFEKKMRLRFKTIVGETISVLRRHLNTEPWTDKDYVSSARLLRMPEGTKGVILDATGALSSVYTARTTEFDVLSITPVRNYQNATIFESPTSATGKVKVKAQALDLADEAVKALSGHYGDAIHQRRLLVVTAADDERVAGDVETSVAFRTAFARVGLADFDVATWGAIDGKSKWRDFDTLLIVSLNYGSSTMDTNTWLAIQGLGPDDDALNAADEIRAIKERRIAASVAQAIGRLKLRTMTSEDGSCEPCDVFIRTPNYKGVGVVAKNIVAAVIQTLHGIQHRRFDPLAKKLVRAGKAPVIKQGVGQRLLEHASRMTPGTWENVADVRPVIGATGHGTWFRIQADQKVIQALAEVGAVIEPAVGRRAARLVRR
jgi:hypothetical protein